MVNSLLNFEQVRCLLRGHSCAFTGLQTIPLRAVVGSEGRTHDFTRSFHPPTHLLSRLQQIQLEADHPIEVFQIDQVYFIRDGHHRVALALSKGQSTIKALVTRISVRAPITADMAQEEILERAALSHFLQVTSLDTHCPQSSFSGLPAQLYPHLMQHIEVHRYYLGTHYHRNFTLEEAAASWHDLVYHPLLKVIQQQRLHQEFPRRTDAELYLWLTYHREQLRLKDQYQGDDQVARKLLQGFSERPFIGFIKRLQRMCRAAWAAALEEPQPPK